MLQNLDERKAIIIGCILFVILTIPLFIVNYMYDYLTFDPPRFVNEYLKFLTSLIALIIGFALVNLYWERRLNTVRSTRLKQLLIMHLNHTGSLIQACREAITQEPDCTEALLEKELELHSLRTRLGESSRSILYMESEMMNLDDDQLSHGFHLFLLEINPLLVDVSKMEKFDSSNLLLIKHLENMRIDTRNLVAELGGIYDDGFSTTGR